MPTIRQLVPGDEARLEAFLAPRAESSMFLRSNSREAGLVDTGKRYSGTYVAAFDGNEIIAVVASYWNGALMLQAPVMLEDVAREAVRLSKRPIGGIIGPLEQAIEAQQCLGLTGAPTTMDSAEDLFSLELKSLIVPDALAQERVVCRHPREDEILLLGAWAAAYDVEVLGETPGPELEAKRRDDMEILRREGRSWILTEAEKPVSRTAFNARLPDIVQIGGVYTPPELRGRGYARAAVAGQLIAARDAGATLAILFTGEENVAAQATYKALGFKVIGKYALTLFRKDDPK